MSIGLRIITSVEYSTMPSAFLGARSISVMIALRGSLGSASPYARPASFSYWPTLPKLCPPKVGDSTCVISRRTIPVVDAAEDCGCCARGFSACALDVAGPASASPTDVASNATVQEIGTNNAPIERRNTTEAGAAIGDALGRAETL